MEALRGLAGVLVPMLQIVWIDEQLHAAAASALFTAGRRNLSLVDCTSFESMRRLGLSQVLALDEDFARQGFELLP
jgi:predicted nucleic acid-binding protein